MAVETAAELAIFFEPNDFADVATYTPLGGSPVNLNGIFDNESRETDAGGNVTIVMPEPRFHIRTSDAPNAEEGDALTVRGVDYTIRISHEDGTGTTMLVLERN